jgi:carboxymethylenebutenolidase
MLITETHKDVPTKAGGDMSMLQTSIALSRVAQHANVILGIFLFRPTIPNYPKAKFPGVVVFSEIYQGMASSSAFAFLLSLRHAFPIS